VRPGQSRQRRRLRGLSAGCGAGEAVHGKTLNFKKTVGLNHYFTLTLAGAAIFFGCAPQRPYRIVPPPVADAPPIVRVPPAPTAPPPSEPSRTPMPQEGKISEQDLKRAPALSGSAKDGGEIQAQRRTL
jgi:hypothetical protein